MSFGFSVGDCILLIDIARTQYNNCVAAGGEYHELARDVKTLSNVLELLHDESSNASSPLLRGGRAFTSQLVPAVNGCKHILEDLQTLLAKYEGLSGNKAVNPTRKLWHKIRFGSKIQALGEVRGKIVFYTTTISVLLDAMQLRATGRLEDKLNATSTAMMDAFQSIKVAMVEEALKAKSVSRRQSTASLLSMSTYNEDDKEVWREFRRQLISKGFKSNQLDRHSDMLQAYLLKSEQSSVLDEVGMPQSASQQKDVFHTITDISKDLPPIEEEHHLTTSPSAHQELAVGTSASQHARSGSAPPRDYEKETPTPSASNLTGTSTFLHPIISHAVLQGPEALQQALDLYPQLLQGPYLDVAISSEPISVARDRLQAIVTTALQETSVSREESRSNSGPPPQPALKLPASKIQPTVNMDSLFMESRIISSRMGVKLLALCARMYQDTIVEEVEDLKRWRAYLSPMCSTSRVQEILEEVVRMKTDLVPTAMALNTIRYNWLHKGGSSNQMLESQKAAIIPILDQRFFNLCEKLVCAESHSGMDMTTFWTFETEGSEMVEELIDSQYIALSGEHSARDRIAKSEPALETNRTEDLAISMTEDPHSELREERDEDSLLPSLKCSRCAKPHIEVDLHYNCQKCFNGSWSICLNCYRAGK